MTAWNLGVWATILAGYMNGRSLASATPRLVDMHMGEILAVTYTTLVDLITPGAGNGVAAIQKVDDMLAIAPWPTEDEWMSSSEAQDSQAAMMAEFGPAAVLSSDQPQEVESSRSSVQPKLESRLTPLGSEPI
jgi:hypothetical protein